MTKSGIMKDDRNTPMRRVRHRDGRLLRGGIGLTTGLGWSDRYVLCLFISFFVLISFYSEDEDAPSPLTRRLSKLNLSRRSSASSIMTSATIARGNSSSSSRRTRHPLSRSVSSGALLETERDHRALLSSSFDEYDELENEHDDDDIDDGQEDHTLQKSGEWAQRQRQRLPSSAGPRTPRTMLPPTSWQNRTSTGTRTSTSSVGSAFSLEVTTTGDGSSRMRRPSSTRSFGARESALSNASSFDNGATPVAVRKKQSKEDTDMHNTPSSTASTISIPMPITPKDLEVSSSTNKLAYSDKDRTLPPLPPDGLKKMSSNSRLAFPRPRTFSAASAVSTPISGGVPHTPSPAAFLPTSANTPVSPKVRPLQLPRAAAARGSDRPAVPVPSIMPLSSSSSTSLSLTSRSSMSSLRSPRSPPLPESSLSMSLSSTPAPSSGIARPKPRTGTGMVYRSSSGANSKIRAPLALPSSINNSSSNVNVVSSPAPSGLRIPRPIPL